MKSKKVKNAPSVTLVYIASRAPQSLVKRLDAKAKREGRSRSNMLEMILREALK